LALCLLLFFNSFELNLGSSFFLLFYSIFKVRCAAFVKRLIILTSDLWPVNTFLCQFRIFFVPSKTLSFEHNLFIILLIYKDFFLMLRTMNNLCRRFQRTEDFDCLRDCNTVCRKSDEIIPQMYEIMNKCTSFIASEKYFLHISCHKEKFGLKYAMLVS